MLYNKLRLFKTSQHTQEPGAMVITASTQRRDILLVDPHPLVLFGLKQLTRLYPKLRVLGYVNNGLAALTICQRTKPDIVVSNASLPGMEAWDLIKRLQKKFGKGSIQFIVHLQTIAGIRPFLALSNLSFVLQTSPIQCLMAAMHAALHQMSYYDPSLSLQDRILGENPDPPSYVPTLSSRERQVLKLIAEGYSNKKIASSLTLSVKTIDTHRMNLMKKLGVHNVVQLLHWAKIFHFLEDPRKAP